ncbi:hypothetical protein EFP18_03920 [Burkholderia glumae]|nr:hypothetical protein Y5A_002505 [Burkholderia glumae AU6208]PNL02508.1 hypothetical protein CEQ24_026845 [Burkholderia glumae]QGA38759.1 hypothetical protein GAS19_14770 [Burkholderia glumae]QHP91817.1 hypothetical protein EXE55_13250 [Burkholderia glumae]RQZ74891.1 hypothetical protein DF052_07325 [Burkholderia glumae]
MLARPRFSSIATVASAPRHYNLLSRIRQIAGARLNGLIPKRICGAVAFFAGGRMAGLFF